MQVCVARGLHPEVSLNSERGPPEVLHDSSPYDTTFTMLTVENLLEDFGRRLDDEGVAT